MRRTRKTERGLVGVVDVVLNSAHHVCLLDLLLLHTTQVHLRTHREVVHDHARQWLHFDHEMKCGEHVTEG